MLIAGNEYDLRWRRDGADWVLMHKRRRMGRVVSAGDGMWRSVKSSGFSNIANLSWSKGAVFEAAVRELEWQAIGGRGCPREIGAPAVPIDTHASERARTADTAASHGQSWPFPRSDLTPTATN
jgi:hypothetical protein